ncbi:uncharacterized protein LOC124915421 [Impatiens glandulifera]|uniref:uncharacterized protein LOC124915421 n=1 Tax=Impatiens glandulifera TaxID=253017 RepID=UPI001FB0E85D|nr:uncharacterized protein LOC124915421 [Impatiens glandulifera]
MEAPGETSIGVPLFRDENSSENSDELDKYIKRLELFLRCFGFYQSSALSFSLSWLAFFLIGVALPFIIIEFSYCSDCQKYGIRLFELEILTIEILLAAISLTCISHNLRKYGVKKLLFVDHFRGDIVQFRDRFILKFRGFFTVVFVWFVPCLLLKTGREVSRVIFLQYDSWGQPALTVIALLISWTYLTIIFLSGAAMFNLVCNLQVIHFENYGKLLERDLDVSVYIEEHIRLTHYLSKISHRFRLFVLLELLVVTAGLLVALFQTTGNHGILNLINGGDFAVSSIVETVGIILCLHAATKISHRAQGIASVASRWHAYATCNSSGANLDSGNPTDVLPMYYSDSDLESSTGGYMSIPTNTQLVSYMSSYHKRQAFVTYLQCNPGGFTVFGWTVDRILINTIFFIEFSLFSFVLGKTITVTTK